jgi:hypothetical protein
VRPRHRWENNVKVNLKERVVRAWTGIMEKRLIREHGLVKWPCERLNVGAMMLNWITGYCIMRL